MRIVVRNAGPRQATLHVLPTLWFRNEWSWDPDADKPADRRPPDGASDPGDAPRARRLHARGRARRRTARRRRCCSARTRRTAARSTASRRPRRIPKDGINDHVVSGAATVNPSRHRDQGRRLVPADGAGRWDRPRSGSGSTDGTPGSTGGRGATSTPGTTCSARRSTRLMRRREAEADEFYADLRRAGRAPTTRRWSCARRSPGCSGASSTTATTSPAGSTATRASPPPPPSG